MKVAIPKIGNNVSSHFGKSEGYVIYEVDKFKKEVLTKSHTVGNVKGCHSASFLKEFDVDTVIVSGIGMGAINKLTSSNINVITGASGNTDKVIEEYLNSNLVSNSTNSATCNHDHSHKEHEDNHSCCGSHDHSDDEDHECCGNH